MGRDSGIRSAVTWALIVVHVLTLACLPAPAEAEPNRARLRRLAQRDCFEAAIEEFEPDEPLRLHLNDRRWVSGRFAGLERGDSSLVLAGLGAEGMSSFALRDIQRIQYNRVGHRSGWWIPGLGACGALIGGMIGAAIGRNNTDSHSLPAALSALRYPVYGFIGGGVIGIAAGAVVVIGTTERTRTLWCVE